MTNPYYGRGSAIAPFVLADARDVANEFAAVEAGFDGVTAALTENRLASNSTTSLAIATGAKTLLIGTGRAFAVGQFVSIARTADPTNFMAGQVTSYNATTGVLVVNVTEAGGSGTYAEWTIALSLPGSTATFLRKTGDTMAGPLNLSGDPATDAEATRKAYVDAVTTAAAMLAKMVTVDGSGSGLDADMLDGLHASAFARLSGASFTGEVNVVGAGGAYAGMNTNGDMAARRADGTGVLYLGSGGTRYLFWNGAGFGLVGGQLAVNSGIVWNLGNDGSGSGLDADYLDGLDSTQFLRANANVFNHRSSGANGYLQFNEGDASSPGFISFHTPDGSRKGFVGWNNGSSRLMLNSENGFGGWTFNITPTVLNWGIWHAGNDGAGSGLDADLLDGIDSSGFIQTAGTGIKTMNGILRVTGGGGRADIRNNGDIVAARGDGMGVVFLNTGEDRYLQWNGTDYILGGVGAGLQVNGVRVWTPNNDGSGSGLDADLLDGFQAAAFRRIVSRNLIENGGFYVYDDGFIETWGFVDIGPDSGATWTLPTPHQSWVIPTFWRMQSRYGDTLNTQNIYVTSINPDGLGHPASLSIWNADDFNNRVFIHTKGY